MAFKLFLLTFMLNLNLAFSNIVYDKDDIIINELELNSYLELYKNNYGYGLNKNMALKNIILMKKTINFLLLNNPEFMSLLDENIELQINDKSNEMLF